MYMKARLSDREIKDYRLVLRDNNWYYSQHGLILTEDIDKEYYLSKVFKMNEHDDNIESLKIKLETHYGK